MDENELTGLRELIQKQNTEIKHLKSIGWGFVKLIEDDWQIDVQEFESFIKLRKELEET